MRPIPTLYDGAADIGFIDVPEKWLDKVIAELRNRHDDQQTYFTQNIELKDKKLSYILNELFKSIVEAKRKSLTAHNSNAWCTIVDALQTAAIEAQDDYKLKHLVDVFKLSGELI